jgi:membrane-associated protease RseP (regulator of RpoE activity)
MLFKHLHRMLPVAMLAATAFVAVPLTVAQEDQQQGRIVRIGPDDERSSSQSIPDARRAGANVQSTHWIGLLGGPLTPELRAHVEIPTDQGILVREIVPNSPAAKAGLKNYDILLRANDTQLRDMTDLVELVRTEGQRDGQISLEVLRKGERQSIVVKPEERPSDMAQAGVQESESAPNLSQVPGLERFFENFGENAPFEFRQFGPGVIVGGDGLANMPGGVSISIRKENDQPAQVTVKRGDETWEVVGDDPESLNQLPEDLRPFVERMLRGGANRLEFRTNEAAPGINMPAFGNQGLQQRLDEMERMLQQLLERQSRDANRPTGGQDR